MALLEQLLAKLVAALLFYRFAATLQDIPLKFRVHYGKDANVTEFPYVAALQGCGAAILSDKWVVTAAHCVDNPAKYPGNLIWVGGDQRSNIVQLKFDKIVIHPEYKTMVQLPINDIALLHLNEPLQFTDKIRPVQLPTKSGSSSMKHVFVGKGRDETDLPPRTLQKLELIRLTSEQCLSYLPSWDRILITPYLSDLEKTNICTTRADDLPGLCMGDSGSPLVQDDQLVGIASFIAGGSSCQFARLTLFTNVPTYVHWIKSVTGLQ